MKAKLTRASLQVHPDLRGPVGKQRRRVLVASYFRKEIDQAERQKSRFINVPAGTVVDDPNAFRLVRLGVAVPDDLECRAMTDYTPRQVEAAQLAGELLERGQATGHEDVDATDDDADATQRRIESLYTG